MYFLNSEKLGYVLHCRSFRLDVTGIEDINYFVAVSHLSEDINPQESYHKASLTDLCCKIAL